MQIEVCGFYKKSIKTTILFDSDLLYEAIPCSIDVKERICCIYVTICNLYAAYRDHICAYTPYSMESKQTGNVNFIEKMGHTKGWHRSTIKGLIGS